MLRAVGATAVQAVRQAPKRRLFPQLALRSLWALATTRNCPRQQQTVGRLVPQMSPKHPRWPLVGPASRRSWTAETAVPLELAGGGTAVSPELASGGTGVSPVGGAGGTGVSPVVLSLALPACSGAVSL